MAALLLIAPQAAIPQPLPAAADTWYQIVGPKGQLIGQHHEWERTTPEGRELGRVRELAYRIDGHGPTRSIASLTRSYDRAGQLLRFEVSLVTPQLNARTTGRIAGGKWLLESDTGGRKRSAALAPPKHDLGDPLAVRASAAMFSEVQPGGLAIATLAFAQRPIPGDPTRRLRWWKAGGRLIASDVAENGPDSAVSSLTIPHIGYELSLRRAAGPLDPVQLSSSRELPHEMVPSPYFIRRSALAGKIRYRFGWRFGFTWPGLPITGEQNVKVDGAALQVDICPACGLAEPPPPAALALLRKPTRWIDSDEPGIRAAASRVGTGSDAQRMTRLAGIARAQLAVLDFDGHVPAGTAWRRRSGDCTEDAVVLTALARAAGIPAQVANGLVYSRQRYHGAVNAFLPHSWVVAWVDGRWRSYDISLEGFDASHIALTLGDGDPASIVEANRLAALLDWQAMGEVRKP